MLRHVIALGALVAVTAPAAAQVDSSRVGRGVGRGSSGNNTVYAVRSREGWLGIGVSCNRCSLTAADDGEGRQWSFSEPPTVFSLDRRSPADKAALRIGDTLVAIDGVPLTSPEGGRAFASIRPGQAVRLTYRRDGAEHQVRVVAEAHPVSYQVEGAVLALRRAQEDQERSLALSREQLERTRTLLEEARERMAQQLDQAQSQRDSASVEQLNRLQRVLEEQQRVLARTLAERSALDARDWSEPPPVAVPATPAPAAVPAQPAMPAVPATAPEPPMPAMPPMSYREHRGFGPLRYTGRLGDVIIEARGPGGVTSTEVSDSEVVITSGDLSVRLALRPRATPRPARAPEAARPPEN